VPAIQFTSMDQPYKVHHTPTKKLEKRPYHDDVASKPIKQKEKYKSWKNYQVTQPDDLSDVQLEY